MWTQKFWNGGRKKKKGNEHKEQTVDSRGEQFLNVSKKWITNHLVGRFAEVLSNDNNNRDTFFISPHWQDEKKEKDKKSFIEGIIKKVKETEENGGEQNKSG